MNKEEEEPKQANIYIYGQRIDYLVCPISS